MKKRNILAASLFLLLFSCSKTNNPPAVATASYFNMKAGSLWNYETTNNTPPSSTSNYTLTSTNKDSTIDGKTFHVYTNSSTMSSEYYRVSGTDYYTFQSLPDALGGSKVENLYLKAGASAGTSWSQLYNIVYNSFPLAVTLTHKIEQTGSSRIVNAITYNNVIHVSTNISIAGVPPASLVTNIHYYYAPNVGMIENSSKIDVNYLTIISNTDFTTRLKSAVLQ